jgi:hypothetical protein
MTSRFTAYATRLSNGENERWDSEVGKLIQIRRNTRLIYFSNKSWEQAEDFVFVCEIKYLGSEVLLDLRQIFIADDR